MDAHLSKLLENLKIAELQQYSNLAVYPFSYRNGNKIEYIPLDIALTNKFIEIKEIDEHGSVPELFVENYSDSRVMLLDGEELIGAKQNRVLNATVLLEIKSKTTIPVSCVESSRWEYEEKIFRSSGISMPSYSRGSKMSSVSRSLSMSEGKSYRSDQSEVWDEVDRLSSSAGVRSKTNAMNEVFTSKQDDLEVYLKNFKKLDTQNGLIVFINNKPAGIEYISDERVFEQTYRKILKSYAMDALIDCKVSENSNLENLRNEFLNEILTCETKSYKSVGIGDDVRIETENLVGAGLIVEDELIHFTAVRFSEDYQSIKSRRSFR